MNKSFHVGIVDFETYLPETMITAEELSKKVNIPPEILRTKMGINSKHLGGPEDHPGMMATKAAKALLSRTKINPKEIDMILYAGETYCEYTCWTVGIKLQNEIGADNAYAWDLSFRCAGTPLALKVAKDMMYGDATLNTVLIAGGNANAYLIDLEDPNQSNMFDMSPGGFALILKRDHSENELLGSGIITEHIFCDDAVGRWGGTLNPITDEIGQNPEKLKKAKLLYMEDPARTKQNLAVHSIKDFTGAVRLALKSSNLNQRDIDFIGITHIAPKAHYIIMEELGIDKEKTVYLADDGHCGHVDQLLAVKYGLERGLVKDGSICALLGAGTGYAFACSLVRWGKIK